MVSTLDILKKEKGLVDEINYWDRCIAILNSRLEDVKNESTDYESYTYSLTALESAIKHYQEHKSKHLKKLAEVQIELREHLKKMLS